MKKLGLVLSLTAFCLGLVPVVTEAQWGPRGYHEPQISYPYPGMPQAYPQAPQVMYLAPPTPTIVYSPPQVMIHQVVPAPPQVVVVRPDKTVETTRIQGDGVNVVTQCVHCTVTNTVKVAPKVSAAAKPKVVPGNGNGKAVVKAASTNEWWQDPWLWLIAAAIAILVLLAILIGRSLWGGPHPGPSGPISPPAPWPAPVPAVPASPAVPTAPAPAATAVGAPAPAPPVVPAPGVPAPAVAPPATPRQPRQLHIKCRHKGCPHGPSRSTP